MGRGGSEEARHSREGQTTEPCRPSVRSTRPVIEPAGLRAVGTPTLVVLALLVGTSTPTRAQSHDEAVPTSLSALSFLAGCWAGTMGTLDLREQWTENEGGVMLWTTRFLRDGRVVDWEFGRLLETDDGLLLWPYPKGEASPRGFPLVRVEDSDYVFENLEHDFPVRIVYRRVGADRLEPRIEGRDGEGPGWSIARVACPG